jgi:hypothetical protein
VIQSAYLGTFNKSSANLTTGGTTLYAKTLGHHIQTRKLKIKMRHLIFILIIIAFSGCRSKEQVTYKIINSKDIKTSYLVDSKGAILDTFPSWLKLIKNYKFDNHDSTRVFLPNSKIALDFARLILDPIYGKKQMDSEAPFKIDLIDDKFWFIYGSLPKEYDVGGVAEILISKYDCKILYLLHGK